MRLKRIQTLVRHGDHPRRRAGTSLRFSVSHPKYPSGIRTKKYSESFGVKNADGYGEAIKLSRKETRPVADYLEEKRQRGLAAGKSKLYLNGGGSSSRAASTGPLPSNSEATGSKPRSPPSSVAGHKRRRSDEEDEDSIFDLDDLDDYDDVDLPPAKNEGQCPCSLRVGHQPTRVSYL